MNQVNLAIEIAVKAHRNQLRRGIGDVPYIVHPLRVARMADINYMGNDAICAALLHDVIEDTEVKEDDLWLADVSPHVIQLVKLLTKWWPDSKEQDAIEVHKPKYYGAIAKNDTACGLKLLDRTDNMDDMVRMLSMPECTPSNKKWALNYYNKTLKEFEQLAQACRWGGCVEAYRSSVESLRVALMEGHISTKGKV